MEFDTGPDVQPGHDITIDTSSGSEDLGPATYDSDHDGVADSVVVIDGDHEYVVTDSDHDGTADAMHEFNSSGQEIDPKTGVVTGGDGSTSGTGTDTDGTDTDATPAPSNAEIGDSAPVTDTAPVSDTASVGDITFSDGGTDYDLGHPTTDLDGDGTPDTVVTHLPDGTVVGYSDTDGDGTADQVTQISPDGQVVIGVSDGQGGWEHAATGRLDADGNFVPDLTPSTHRAVG